MRVREAYIWPEDKARARRRAIRLEWMTLASMGSAILVLYLVLGNSQAMKTAWVEDMLSVIPAIAYLVAVSREKKPPSESFPFGFYRAVSIAYLVGATAMFLVGGYLLVDNALTLVNQQHPTIGLMSIGGYDIWGGWLMMAALLYSCIPPVILGRMKTPIAREIHDKPLNADASMQRADWLTGFGAIIGIWGIGFGFWWADAAAAIFISLDVIYDGGKHVKRAMGDLADRAPHTVNRDKRHPALDAAKEAAVSVQGVKNVAVKFREEGHLLTGTVYAELEDEADVITRLDSIRDAVEESDWRFYDIVVTPVRPGGL